MLKNYARTIPKCHPNRAHYAKGLCTQCYARGRYKSKGVTRSKRMAECHPDRPHLAKGKCSQCYYRAVYADPDKRASILAYQAAYRAQA